MAEKESSSKQWSDPKDFGLPFVEVSPLASLKTKVKPVAQEVPLVSPEAVKKATLVALEKKIEPQPSRPVLPPSASSSDAPKKSKVWVWIVVLILIAAVSTSVWQLKLNETLVGVFESQQTEELPKPIPVKESNSVIAPATNAMDTLLAQDSAQISSTELPANSTNSGTSIATSSKLVRVQNKEPNTRFFLVIGSFGSEEETMRFIQKVGNKFPEYYLVYPFEKNPNYRLAMGAYTNWNEASAKLAELKASSTNSYWILTY
jgi:hypothetical protein